MDNRTNENRVNYSLTCTWCIACDLDTDARERYRP